MSIVVGNVKAALDRSLDRKQQNNNTKTTKGVPFSLSHMLCLLESDCLDKT